MKIFAQLPGRITGINHAAASFYAVLNLLDPFMNPDDLRDLRDLLLLNVDLSSIGFR